MATSLRNLNIISLNSFDLTVLDIALCQLKDDPTPLVDRPELISALVSLHDEVLDMKRGPL